MKPTNGEYEVHERLGSLLAGDPSAAAWLYDRFAPNLLRRLRGRYGSSGVADPEDLLQDAYVFYFQRNGKVLADFLEHVPRRRQTPQRLGLHLWNLACGLASNRRRSLRRAKATLVSLSTDHLPTRDGCVEQRTIDRDVLKRLDRYLEGRGTRIHHYFTLRYREGLSPRQICHATGWSKKVTYKLKQVLGEAVERCNDELGLRLSRDSAPRVGRPPAVRIARGL